MLQYLHVPLSHVCHRNEWCGSQAHCHKLMQLQIKDWLMLDTIVVIIIVYLHCCLFCKQFKSLIFVSVFTTSYNNNSESLWYYLTICKRDHLVRKVILIIVWKCKWDWLWQINNWYGSSYGKITNEDWIGSSKEKMNNELSINNVGKLSHLSLHEL